MGDFADGAGGLAGRLTVRVVRDFRRPSGAGVVWGRDPVVPLRCTTG